MHPRLRLKLLRPKPRPHRHIVDTLLESMDVCDATRSHETHPSRRWRARHGERRALAWVGWAVLAAGSLALVAMR